MSRDPHHTSPRCRTVSLNAEKKPDYSRDLYLREEAESPFRKVRFFGYLALGGGALVSLFVSLARIAAATLAGINTDLLSESLTNAAIDAAGLVLLAFLYQRDVDAQESRLERASKGAALAKLMVRVKKSMVSRDNADQESLTTSLASLRRGRGMEKRVVIAMAGETKLAIVLQQAAQWQESLVASDLLVVPVVVSTAAAPTTIDQAIDCVALPVGNAWRAVVEDEVAEAVRQGVNVEEEGICVILKKNGRVGQRTKGIFLDRMVGEVQDRQRRGMDVSNI